MTSSPSKSNRLNALGRSLTGGQIQEALDFLIYQGLQPIVLYSNIFDLQLAHLLYTASTNRKRKISALPREEFLTNLSNALLTTDPQVKLDILASSKIERVFVYGFLVRFLEALTHYRTLYSDYLVCVNAYDRQALDRKLAVLEQSVGFSRNHLFSAIHTVEKYLNLTYAFRNSIVEQYIKHAYKQTHAFCKQRTGDFDFKEVHQSLMAAITKAIDKYDSSRGALTSYINFWILNAQSYSNTNYGHEYGIAYTIPQAHKRTIQGEQTNTNNFSVSLDASSDGDEEAADLKNYLVGCSGVDIELEEKEEQSHLLYLIKAADRQGLARLYLDLDEYFSDREKTLMVASMKKQLGKIPTTVPSNILRKYERYSRKNKV